MITTVFSGEDYEPRDRFEAWCDLMSSIPSEHRIRSDHAADFVPSIHVSRTPRMIRQVEASNYLLQWCRSGRLGAEQSGSQMSAAVGQWIVLDSCRPHSSWSVIEGPGNPAVLTVTVPKSMLGLNDGAVAPLLTGSAAGRPRRRRDAHRHDRAYPARARRLRTRGRPASGGGAA